MTPVKPKKKLSKFGKAALEVAADIANLPLDGKKEARLFCTNSKARQRIAKARKSRRQPASEHRRRKPNNRLQGTRASLALVFAAL
jgi:hypothetical protein